jgi:putative endonuclease
MTDSAQEEMHYPMYNSVNKMKNSKSFYVYIMTNGSRVLYTGVTSDLQRRVYEHKHKLIVGFTQKYNLTQLVYCEETPGARDAITREK